MPAWIPVLVQVLPFVESIIRLLVSALRKKPTERRERIAQKLENLLLQHMIDKDEEKLHRGIKEIQEEIKQDDC